MDSGRVHETSWPEDRWIQALEVAPGAADGEHHVLIAIMEYGEIAERTYRAV